MPALTWPAALRHHVCQSGNVVRTPHSLPDLTL